MRQDFVTVVLQNIRYGEGYGGLSDTHRTNNIQYGNWFRVMNARHSNVVSVLPSAVCASWLKCMPSSPACATWAASTNRQPASPATFCNAGASCRDFRADS